MPQRHLARTISLQGLAEWDFNQSVLKRESDLKEIFFRYLNGGGATGLKEKEFSKKLIDIILNKIDKVDDYIKKYAPQWPIEQITLIDRNVLRLGIVELVFLKETPPRVVINEAIEMAKTFGGQTSGKFVNGVLGAIYEDIKKEDEKSGQS
jgi:N utilization substance protein B